MTARIRTETLFYGSRPLVRTRFPQRLQNRPALFQGRDWEAGREEGERSRCLEREVNDPQCRASHMATAFCERKSFWEELGGGGGMCVGGGVGGGDLVGTALVQW